MKRIALLLFVVLAASVARGASPPARHASLPAVSPDGRWIAFLSDRDSGAWQLYVVRPNGRDLRRLGHTTEQVSAPAWSGNRIVYAVLRGDSAAVMTTEPGGDAPRPLLSLLGKSPALSRDGKRLAYTEGSWTRNRLMVTDVAGSAHGADGAGGPARMLMDSTDGGSFNLAWAPNDSLLAYTHMDANRDMQVWIVDVASGHARQLTHFGVAGGRPQWPTWSPDGRSIAVQSGVYDHADDRRSVAHLWRVDVASGNATRLAPHEEPWLDETPSWFPDGKRIAYQSTKSGRFELWVMNADGSGARQLTR